jgi:L-arabinose transport system ATP-binding protein
MTVAENIYLGQLPHKGGIVNRSLLNYEAGLQLKHLGLDIDPETPLKYLYRPVADGGDCQGAGA